MGLRRRCRQLCAWQGGARLQRNELRVVSRVVIVVLGYVLQARERQRIPLLVLRATCLSVYLSKQALTACCFVPRQSHLCRATATPVPSEQAVPIEPVQTPQQLAQGKRVHQDSLAAN